MAEFLWLVKFSLQQESNLCLAVLISIVKQVALNNVLLHYS